MQRCVKFNYYFIITSFPILQAVLVLCPIKKQWDCRANKINFRPPYFVNTLTQVNEISVYFSHLRLRKTISPSVFRWLNRTDHRLYRNWAHLTCQLTILSKLWIIGTTFLHLVAVSVFQRIPANWSKFKENLWSQYRATQFDYDRSTPHVSFTYR